MKNFYRPSVRLGLHGHPMKDDNHSIDITTDLTDGSDGGLGDINPNAAGNDVQMQAPAGTEPVHGKGAQHVNTVDNVDTDKETSLRDQLSSAFKAEDGKPSTQENAQNVQAPAIQKDAEGKYRNLDGTYASQEQIDALNNTAAAAPAQGEAPVVDPNLLTGFTPVEQQLFQSLPAELQQLVGRTMEDLNTRQVRYSEYDLIEQQLIGPRREALQANGTSVPMALNNLFALSDFAGRAPGDFVMWFAEQNGLDLDALLDAKEAQGSIDPAVQQLQATVQQLQGTLNAQQQGQVQQQHEARLNEVQNFSMEKDEGGNLKRPYLTDVMDGWASQIQAIRIANPNMPNAEVLQKAYDNACWSTPAVRAKMQEAAQAQSRQTEAAKVAQARSAGSSVTGAPAGSQPTVENNVNRTLREELQMQFAAQST